MPNRFSTVLVRSVLLFGALTLATLSPLAPNVGAAAATTKLEMPSAEHFDFVRSKLALYEANGTFDKDSETIIPMGLRGVPNDTVSFFLIDGTRGGARIEVVVDVEQPTVNGELKPLAIGTLTYLLDPAVDPNYR